MKLTPSLRSVLAFGASAMALAAALPAAAQDSAAAQPAAKPSNTVGELVITAQRREENIQDVPIAVSAFSGDSLKSQRIETGADLLLAVPNVTFSRGNFGGFNFQIRGIGTKLVASSGDAAIGIHENNVPLTANTLADSEFYDVQRVEVLRGPQGTQFGRNTTGGLVNVITNEPTDDFSGQITGELGNYNTKRTNGYINLPMGDMLALRVAGTYINRDGFGKNLVTGNDVDGRDIWSTRATLAFTPADNFKAKLMWEHFNEDDSKARVGKQLCVTDPGLTSIGGVTTVDPDTTTQQFFTQGCKKAALGPDSLDSINSLATLGGGLGQIAGIINGNAYAGKKQNPDLRTIESVFDPIYQAESDVYQLNMVWNLTDTLELSYTAGYTSGNSFTEADYNRLIPTGTLVPNAHPFGLGFLPAITDDEGYYDDPQVGRRNAFTTIDFTKSRTSQRTHEVRLQSSFDGPFNFSAGASYLKFKSNGEYFVTSNTLSALSEALNITSGCPARGDLARPDCIYFDPNPIPDGSGGNYFDSKTIYQVTSYAAFGEGYYQINDQLKATVGLRYTSDHKLATPFSPRLLTPGIGQIPLADQRVTFNEVTGRANLEWSPELSFTDATLIYASYSRGYKAGGFNPPASPGQNFYPASFDPEFIDAFELGTKNTLLDGSLVLNATAFYYNYNGYQISSIIQRTAVNANIDAKIYGLELESIWEPIQNVRLNATVGYLHTKLGDNAQLDLMDLTQGNPDYATVKNASSFANCIAPVTELAALQTAINATNNPAAAAAMGGVCSGMNAADPSAGSITLLGVTLHPLPGFTQDLGGNKLPNSPELTLSLGAQYTWNVAGWDVIPRADFYYQSKSYSRIFNAINDHLDSYTNLNLSLAVNNDDLGLSFQAYVKNATDETVITDKYQTDDTSGLFTNIFLTEPRTYGVSVTKRF